MSSFCIIGDAVPKPQYATMSDHAPVSRPNPIIDLLFGGNMLEGTFKAVVWVALLSAVLAWTTFR
jgi:hypothetical protein